MPKVGTLGKLITSGNRPGLGRQTYLANTSRFKSGSLWIYKRMLLLDRGLIVRMLEQVRSGDVLNSFSQLATDTITIKPQT